MVLTVAAVYILLCLAATLPLNSQPQYAARKSKNCQSCHVSPTGGFGRWANQDSLTFQDDRVFLSGDFRFLALYDVRPDSDRSAFFPMEGTLSVGVEATPGLTLAFSNDFGRMRELYALIKPFHQSDFYVRTGWFSLPYGLLIPDHTSFIKEGRVENTGSSFQELGIGAGIFGVRNKDAGVEAGFSGKPLFLNVSVTNGRGAEDRPSASTESDTQKAVTGRAGILGEHFLLGGSYYRNKEVGSDNIKTRAGVFGWLAKGPVVLLGEYDEGEDGPITVVGSTLTAAGYVELLLESPFQWFPGFAKFRYEYLDPSDRVRNDELERLQAGFEWFAWPKGTLEFIYRNNRETPPVKNDDYILMNHFFF